MVFVEFPIHKKSERQLQNYEEKFNEHKIEISDIRKSGRDTFFAETKMIAFAPLVRMARVTYDDVDVFTVKHLLDDVGAEIELAKHGIPLEHALTLISQAIEKISSGDYRMARADYNVLADIYSHLCAEEKLLIAEACILIREKLIHYS